MLTRSGAASPFALFRVAFSVDIETSPKPATSIDLGQMIETAVEGRESPIHRARHVVLSKLGILADQKECERLNDYNAAVTSAFEALRKNRHAAGRIGAASVPNASIGTV